MSVAERPGYQLTPLGWLPLDWEVQRLSALTKSYAGGTPDRSKSDYFEGDIPWVKSGEVNFRKITKTEERISEIALSKSSAKLAESGSVLVAMYGATAGKVARLKIDAAINQAVLSIRSIGGAIDNDFLFWVMESSTEKLLSMCQGAAQPNLSKGLIDGLEVATPPLPEQQKIAAILTAVDDKLDVIARQIEATKTLKQGLMQTLFTRGVGTQDTDGRWVPHAEFKESELGEIPAGWTLMPLEELAIENITYGVVQPGESVEGGIPLVRGGDIKGGRIAANLRTISTEISNQFKRTILKGGELLVSLVGYPGETAVVPSQLAGANIARQAGMIRTGSVSTSEFIHYYLSSPVGKSFLLVGMIGSAQQVINLKALREVLIPLPSVAERVRICSICSAVTKKLQALEDKQSSFQDLKRGLMQKLLTGEWRVNVVASATGT